MEIRPATVADLPHIERLHQEIFAAERGSAWWGVPSQTQLRVRLKMWDLTGYALPGLLVGLDGDRLVGTVAVSTSKTVVRFSWRQLPVLAELGFLRMMRFLGVWALSYYAPPADEAYLHSMVVIPEYRRQSAATALTMAAEELARQWGMPIASARVATTNTASLRLLETLGYSLTKAAPRTLLDRLRTSRQILISAKKAL